MKQFIVVNGLKYYKRPFLKKIRPELSHDDLYHLPCKKLAEKYFITYKEKVYVRKDYKSNIRKKGVLNGNNT